MTDDNAHSSSGYYMMTGCPHAPISVENAKPGAPNDWPSLGGLVRKRAAAAAASCRPRSRCPSRSANDGNLTWPGQDAGFLGRAADPWLLNCDPRAATSQSPA